MEYILIVIGFVLLIVGANFLVDGASGLAKRFNVPDLVIGLTVVAFGTSAPEMMVNIAAAINKSTEIALTNIIGSNTINTLVILGISAAIYPISSQKSSRFFDIPMSVLAGIIVIVLALGADKEISRLDGIILLLIFSVFMTITIRKGIKNPQTVSESYKPLNIWLALLMILGGLIGLAGGGQLIVRSATKIAINWGVSQAMIGLTIVALGTSLPELATSAVAAYKKNSDLALGNVIGSNIFNVFFVLGVSSTIFPLPAYNGMIIDALAAAVGSLLVLCFVFTNKQHKILRWEGILLLLIYAAYLYFLIAGLK